MKSCLCPKHLPPPSPPGGYYLTSAYGAMSLIRNFQEEQAARVLSSQTKDTLHQWHRRRTTLHSAPSIDDFQVRRSKVDSPRPRV